MGGLGKTTLAQLVCKRQSYFDETIWISVSNDFNVERLLGDMLQYLTKTNHQLTSTGALVSKLQEYLRARKYLLVLDNIWNDNEDEWNHMRNCLLGIDGSKESKILATTRSENVARAIRTSDTYQLDILSGDHSWELFKKCTCLERGATRTPELMAIGKRILERCGGVPLAIRTIGGLLYSKNSKSEWLMIEKGKWSTYSEGNKVFSTIKFSYDHLPSLPLKQCFAYCAIFEKGTVLKKDKLIQHWMAQGFLRPQLESQSMEDIGSDYCNVLLRNSLFQDAEKDGDNNITAFKMHDLVQDVLVKVSENYCLHVKDLKSISNKIEAVHVLINSSDQNGMWESLKVVLPSMLQTLHLKGHDLPEDLFENFQCLTLLIIDNEGVKELPNSIGKMKHLRFLDISCTGIKKLPKSFIKLYHLQTLRVWDLIEVPKGFGNLINLRHIHIANEDHCATLFPGLSKLKNLQTLPYFVVGKCKGCQIEELEHLDNLRGELKLSCLQNVGSKGSAANSNLFKKSNIQTLKLHWNKEREENYDDSDIMEGLKPHSNLKSLTIDGYQIPNFPTWMVESDMIVLCDLKKLTLKNLNKCEGLPPLGDLPSLEYLEIVSLHRVKYIGEEFYGSKIHLFPALKVLKMICMDSLVEWSDVFGIISSTSLVFPNLEEMDIRKLPNLRVFPNLGSLSSLRQLKVLSCDNLTISDSYRDIQKDYFTSLRELSFSGCDKLIEPFCSLASSFGLESLVINCHPNLWPKDLRHLLSLRELHLEATLKIFREFEQLDYFPWPYPAISDAIGLSLTSLELNGFGLPEVTSLPHQIQYIPTLMHLTIKHFDKLEDVPEWLGKLERLQILVIGYCKNLKKLFSAESFQHLINLEFLWIYNSPILEQQCKRGQGLEWPKIAHIRTLKLGA